MMCVRGRPSRPLHRDLSGLLCLKQIDKINKHMYTAHYCAHGRYLLKSVNQIVLNIHSRNQISYSNIQTVHQLIYIYILTITCK
jgi:hypothetical protein